MYGVCVCVCDSEIWPMTLLLYVCVYGKASIRSAYTKIHSMFFPSWFYITQWPIHSSLFPISTTPHSHTNPFCFCFCFSSQFALPSIPQIGNIVLGKLKSYSSITFSLSHVFFLRSTIHSLLCIFFIIIIYILSPYLFIPFDGNAKHKLDM